jgi:hypothetical protein
MNFDQQIKDWVQLDNQLKMLNEKVKEIRDKKNYLHNGIIDYVSKNDLLHSNIKIGDSKFKITNTNIANPLTFKYLEKCLGEVIRNEKQVTQIMDYVKSKREIKSIYEIKRYSNN